MLLKVYDILLKEYGKQGWWPVTEKGMPKYSGGPKTDKQRLEVIIGAILTQNTSWKNAEKAIINLNKNNVIEIEKLKKIKKENLEKIIRSSGFFRQKAERLKGIVDFLDGKKWDKITRNELLAIKGIGSETADSILLYAFGKPEFVVDSYTKRIFNRIGLIKTEKYDEVKRFFESNLKKMVKGNLVPYYNEYHALIVEHAKRFCRKKPECNECPLLKDCKFGKSKLN